VFPNLEFEQHNLKDREKDGFIYYLESIYHSYTFDLHPPIFAKGNKMEAWKEIWKAVWSFLAW
jgi:hypothetical protein